MPSSNRTSSARRAARRAKMTPAELEVDRARLTEKKRRQRYRRYFERDYGRAPEGADDEKDVRRMMRGHPWGCCCYSCLWEPDAADERAPRVARSWETITARAGKE